MSAEYLALRHCGRGRVTVVLRARATPRVKVKREIGQLYAARLERPRMFPLNISRMFHPETR